MGMMGGVFPGLESFGGLVLASLSFGLPRRALRRANCCLCAIRSAQIVVWGNRRLWGDTIRLYFHYLTERGRGLIAGPQGAIRHQSVPGRPRPRPADALSCQVILLLTRSRSKAATRPRTSSSKKKSSPSRAGTFAPVVVQLAVQRIVDCLLPGAGRYDVWV